MGSLEQTGKTLALIGAVIALVLAILDLIGTSLEQLFGISLSPILSTGFGGYGAILTILFAFILLLITSGRISITETIVLGIIVIVFAVLIGGIGGLIAVLGGILIILDILTKN